MKFYSIFLVVSNLNSNFATTKHVPVAQVIFAAGIYWCFIESYAVQLSSCLSLLVAETNSWYGVDTFSQNQRSFIHGSLHQNRLRAHENIVLQRHM
jgi:hypothetical protein